MGLWQEIVGVWIMKKFRAKSSIGDIYVELDESKGNKDLLYGKEIESFHWDSFEVIEPKDSSIKLCKQEYSDKALYDGSPYSIHKLQNGEYFLIIELSDEYYGAPEYYLEEVVEV